MKNKKPIDSEEEEFGKGLSYELPKSTRWIISIPIIILILSILGVYAYLIFKNPRYIDPAKYGFPTTLIMLIITVIIVNMPWSKLGFRIKKIGMIELENVVKGQAQNSSKELADLQHQIDELKSNLSDNKDEISADKKLDDLVVKFLKQYNQWAFSALRIKNWGAKQIGFEEFSEKNTQEIRESLRRLLSKDQVVTRISRKGNTIYKIH